MATVTWDGSSLAYPSERYADIRLALGLAADDTDALPDSVITAGIHLPWVLLRVPEHASTCMATIAADAALLERLTVLCAEWAAARIAGNFLANRDNDDVIKSKGVDTLRITFGDPLKQKELHEAMQRLGDAALSSLIELCPAIASTFSPVVVAMAGPSRAVSEGTMTWREYLNWSEEMLPLTGRSG